MNKITTTLLATLGLLCAAPLAAQETTTVVADTITLTDADYARAIGIEDWDKIAEDSLLPITRDQAEELIVKMIVASRADSQRQLKEAEVLNDYKVEMLKNKLLESALRKVYTEEYEKRLDRLETLLILSLAQQNGGKLDPSVMNYLLGQGSTPPAVFYNEGQQTTPGAASALVPGGSTTSTSLTNGQDGETEMVPLAPGAKASSWDHFLSQVFFGFDSSELSADAKVVLDNVAGWIKETKMPVELRGYASPEGNMRYNNRLSGRRVSAAADYLRAKGITDEFLRVVPSGEDTIKETSSQYPDARRVDIRPYYGE